MYVKYYRLVQDRFRGATNILNKHMTIPELFRMFWMRSELFLKYFRCCKQPQNRLRGVQDVLNTYRTIFEALHSVVYGIYVLVPLSFLPWSTGDSLSTAAAVVDDMTLPAQRSQHFITYRFSVNAVGLSQLQIKTKKWEIWHLVTLFTANYWGEWSILNFLSPSFSFQALFPNL